MADVAEAVHSYWVATTPKPRRQPKAVYSGPRCGRCGMPVLEEGERCLDCRLEIAGRAEWQLWRRADRGY